MILHNMSPLPGDPQQPRNNCPESGQGRKQGSRLRHAGTLRTHSDLSPDGAESSAVVPALGVVMPRASSMTYRPFRHAIKSLGLGRRMIYLFCRTLDISRALVGCAVSCAFAHFVPDVGQETIRQAFLRFGNGSWYEASFLRPRPCSCVFVHLVLLRSVRSGRRFAQLVSRGVRAVCGLGDSLDSRSAALFSAYGGH